MLSDLVGWNFQNSVSKWSNLVSESVLCICVSIITRTYLKQWIHGHYTHFTKLCFVLFYGLGVKFKYTIHHPSNCKREDSHEYRIWSMKDDMMIYISVTAEITIQGKSLFLLYLCICHRSLNSTYKSIFWQEGLL